MKIVLCAIIFICTSAIGVNLYKASLKKLTLLESFRNMFFMFDAYISAEHCGIRECISSYIRQNDDVRPILEAVLNLMTKDKQMGFAAAMQEVLAGFLKTNPSLLEKKDAELIVHSCRVIEELKRESISDYFKKTGEVFEKRIAECKDKDVKNGKLFNKMGFLIGIVLIILII